VVHNDHPSCAENLKRRTTVQANPARKEKPFAKNAYRENDGGDEFNCDIL
jgi:hypothetical protein